jgi:hypothetical protein
MTDSISLFISSMYCLSFNKEQLNFQKVLRFILLPNFHLRVIIEWSDLYPGTMSVSSIHDIRWSERRKKSSLACCLGVGFIHRDI